MLEVNVKWIKYGNFILNDINFTLSKGDVLLIIGPNGSGKTTILYAILGLLRYEGIISINGAKPGSIEARRNVAFIPEKPLLYDKVSGKYNIKHFLFINEISFDKVYSEMLDVAKRIGVEEALKKKVATYSLGTKRKINLIEAYLLNRPINLLDDYSSNFDEMALKFILNWIRNEKEKIFVLTSPREVDFTNLEKEIERKVKILNLLRED